MDEKKSMNASDRILEVKIDSLKELNNLKFNGIEQVLLRMEKDSLDRKAEHAAKHLEIDKSIENIMIQAGKDRERTDIKITGLQKIVWMSTGAATLLSFIIPLAITVILYFANQKH